MVRAILAGRKTQTRRVVNGAHGRCYLDRDHGCRTPSGRVKCPQGIPGDRLWVKETFQTGDYAQNEPRGVVYRATDPDWESTPEWKWKPAIFMPRLASRITLDLTSLRVQRLQDISEADAIAEGLYPNPKYPQAELYTWDDVQGNSTNPCYAYQLLWESIHGANSWADNPWVWVETFKQVFNDELSSGRPA